MWLGDYLRKAQVEEIACIFFFRLVYLCCFVSLGPTHYVISTMQLIYAESAVKHEQTNPN